ncbi:MAG: helix-turn-helix domain-containing protein [Clostridia bacterium]|nr:helix-turn-helix domain-containing protein [Clostridia bacterium]
MNYFTERLKELRIEKGLSLVQLAKETGISKSAISFWENGDRIPTALNIITLAKYFEVSADYLLGLED